MIIKKESDYAVRLIRGLSDGKRHSASELAESQGVPKLFAYKIMKKLHHAGVVEVYQGVTGGYKLSVDLDEISLLRFLSVTENSLLRNICMEENSGCEWEETQEGRHCSVHRHLHAIQDIICRELERHSVRDILSGNVEYSIE